LGVVTIPLLTSIKPLFPLFLGSFILCTPIELALFYLFLVGVLFNSNLYFLYFLLFGYRLIILEIVKQQFHYYFHHFTSLVIVYLLWWTLDRGNPLFYLYNFLFDYIVTVALFKCELKSL
jgi:hypothetical protein